MPDLTVDADLRVRDGATSRDLETEDLGVDRTGAAKETTLAALVAELVGKLEPGDLAALATEATLEQVRDRLVVDVLSGGVEVRDTYTVLEALEDQSGNGTVRTFTFAAARDLIWVRCDGDGEGRVKVGSDPDADSGVVCEDGVPQPLTVRTTEVRVYADAGTIRVWGYGA